MNHIEKMRKRSGTVKSKDKLVCFLYVLMRDYIVPGKVEGLMIEQKIESIEETVFTNGWLANYAKDLAKRLK